MQHYASFYLGPYCLPSLLSNKTQAHQLIYLFLQFQQLTFCILMGVPT